MRADVSTSERGGEPAEVASASQAAAPTWPAGWYDVPDRVNTRGYWDGERWTGDFVPKDTPRAAAPVAAGTAAGESKTGLLVCLTGLVALAVGSVGPWVTAVFVSADGTQGDGKLTLIAAGLGALFLLLARGTAILTALLALGGLGVAIYDIVHVSQKAQELTINGTQIAHVGWGLYVCAGGAVIAFIGALMHYGGRARVSQPTEAAH